MSEQNRCVPSSGLTWLFMVVLLLKNSGVLLAEELGGRALSWEPRVAAAKNLSPAGCLLSNERPGQPWRGNSEGDILFSRDLLQALPGLSARLETKPRAVELTLSGNLPELSDFSGLQSAVILHDSRAFDLDFTLHLGRVLLTNRKESGAARVWLRVDGAAFELTLAEPGATICLGLNSYWPSGVGFSLTPQAEEVPVRRLRFFVVQGAVDVTESGTQHALSAPPGRAYFHWDSINGSEEGARPRRQVDAWADTNRKETPQAKMLEQVLDQYRAAVKTKTPRTVLFELLDAVAKERDRARAKVLAEFAVYGLAAINDMDRVMQVLDDPRQADARKAAAIALRHWIGDAAGRDRRLYHFLIERLRYSKAQSATVLQLLHSALAADEPDTYDVLLSYLRHEKLVIRELAWRQLLRMVPKDLAVPYDPAASAAERAKAYAAWKEAIPSGSLPTRKPKKQ
jgi:hypothetical protein